MHSGIDLSCWANEVSAWAFNWAIQHFSTSVGTIHSKTDISFTANGASVIQHFNTSVTSTYFATDLSCRANETSAIQRFTTSDTAMHSGNDLSCKANEASAWAFNCKKAPKLS